MIDLTKKSPITENNEIKLGLLLVTLSVVLSLGGILADILENFLMLAKLENYLKNLAWFLASPKISSSKNEANPWQKSHQRPTLSPQKSWIFRTTSSTTSWKKPKNFREINVVPRPQILISRQNVETSPIDRCRVVLPEISWFFPLFFDLNTIKKIFLTCSISSRRLTKLHYAEPK